MMIRNIIFDIGRVLVAVNWEPLMEKLGFDAETSREVTDAMWHNPDWNELDRGVLSDEEVLKLFIAKAPAREREIRTVFAHFGELVEMKRGAVEIIERLKAEGYGVYYLSNYFEYLMHTAPQALEFISHTDGGVFSCHVKITKPERRIYEILCERYALDPRECLFIDDTERNLTAAQALGISTLQMKEQTLEELYEQIVSLIRNSECGMRNG